MGRQLITSALPYINGVKHLGTLVGSMLPADVYARYLRLRGNDVLLICATDEHGTPAELAAAEAGLSVEEYCTQQHAIQADLVRRFGLSFDHFGRSSSEQNAELTRHFAAQLRDNGMVRSGSPTRSTRWTTSGSCRIATSSARARTAATTAQTVISARTVPVCSSRPT